MPYRCPIAYALSAGPGPGPVPPDLRGPRGRPSEGPGGQSAEGPVEKAQQMISGGAGPGAGPANRGIGDRE